MPRRLDIRLGGQRVDLQPHPVSAARWFGAAAPDHTGRGSAVAVRGAVHWVTHRSGPARALAAEPGVRARLPRTFRVEGEEHVVWVTDAEGDDALEFAPATGIAPGATPRRLAAGQLGRVLSLAMAPDGSRAAVASHDGRVLLVERETGEVREVDRSEDGDVSGLVFSPDSAWLAWSHPGPSPAAPAQARQHRRPVGDRGDAAALPGLRARVHPRRQAPRVPLRALLRPGLRRARLRPRVRRGLAAAPDHARRDHPVPVRPAAARPALRHARTAPPPRPPTARAPPPPVSTSKGSPTASSPFPVEAARYSTLRAAKDGVAVAAAPGPGRARRVPGHPRRPRPQDASSSATTSPSSASSTSPRTPTTSRSAATASASCCGPTASSRSYRATGAPRPTTTATPTSRST